MPGQGMYKSVVWGNHKKHAGCVDSRIVQHNGERGTSSGSVCQELSSRGVVVGVADGGSGRRCLGLCFDFRALKTIRRLGVVMMGLNNKKIVTT